MLAHAVAVTADVDHVAVMHEAVDEGCGHDLIAQDRAPLLEALVRGEHSGGVLVAVADELEEEHRSVSAQGQIADLIDDQSSASPRISGLEGVGRADAIEAPDRPDHEMRRRRTRRHHHRRSACRAAEICPRG